MATLLVYRRKSLDRQTCPINMFADFSRRKYATFICIIGVHESIINALQHRRKNSMSNVDTHVHPILQVSIEQCTTILLSLRYSYKVSTVVSNNPCRTPDFGVAHDSEKLEQQWTGICSVLYWIEWSRGNLIGVTKAFLNLIRECCST